MAWPLVAAMAASSVYSSIQANQQARRTQSNAMLQYGEEARIVKQRMLEQQDIAREEMTNVTLEFLDAEAKMESQITASGLAGKTAQRRLNILKGKASEAKSKISRDVDTNVINIANNMIVKKIDTDRTLANAEAQKTGALGILAKAGLAGMKAYASAGGFTRDGMAEFSIDNIFGNRPDKIAPSLIGPSKVDLFGGLGDVTYGGLR